MTELLVNPGITRINEPKLATEQKSVVVVGMGNSHTHLIAQALHALGVFMGGAEDAPVMMEDKELSGMLERNVSRKELKDFLEERSAVHPIWGFNRPGSMRYLRRYEKVFPNPYYIVVFRDLAAMTAHRLKSGDANMLQVFRKTYRHFKVMIDFLQKTKQPCLIVSHEKMWLHPDSLINEIVGYLGLEPEAADIEKAIGLFDPKPQPQVLDLELGGEIGALDPLDGTIAKGWAVAHGAGGPISVEVLVDGEVVKQVKADVYRAGLENRGMGNGKFGFAVDLAEFLTADQEREVRVRTAQGGTELNNSPRRWETTS